jgi:hypothetical protein
VAAVVDQVVPVAVAGRVGPDRAVAAVAVAAPAVPAELVAIAAPEVSADAFP